MTSTTRVKVKNSLSVKKSYNKTVIDFNFGRHEVLSTLKSDIHLGLPMPTSLKSIIVYYHITGNVFLL